LNVKQGIAFLPVVLLIFFQLTSSFQVFASSESDARSAIVAADGKIIDSYYAVLDAEKAGANITVLLSSLTKAGDLLSRATLTFAAGNFDSAYTLASQSQEELNGLVADANFLRESAVQIHYWDFVVNVVESIIATVLVFSSSAIIWLLLKRRYGKIGSVN